ALSSPAHPRQHRGTRGSIEPGGHRSATIATTVERANAGAGRGERANSRDRTRHHEPLESRCELRNKLLSALGTLMVPKAEAPPSLRRDGANGSQATCTKAAGTAKATTAHGPRSASAGGVRLHFRSITAGHSGRPAKALVHAIHGHPSILPGRAVLSSLVRV